MAIDNYMVFYNENRSHIKNGYKPHQRKKMNTENARSDTLKKENLMTLLDIMRISLI